MSGIGPELGNHAMTGRAVLTVLLGVFAEKAIARFGIDAILGEYVTDE